MKENTEYPKEIIRVVNNLFPKGDKRREDALVLQTVAYLEGKERGKMEVLKKLEKEIKVLQEASK